MTLLPSTSLLSYCPISLQNSLTYVLEISSLFTSLQRAFIPTPHRSSSVQTPHMPAPFPSTHGTDNHLFLKHFLYLASKRTRLPGFPPHWPFLAVWLLFPPLTSQSEELPWPAQKCRLSVKCHLHDDACQFGKSHLTSPKCFAFWFIGLATPFVCQRSTLNLGFPIRIIFQASLLTQFADQNPRSHSWFLHQTHVQCSYHGLSQYLKSSWFHSDDWIIVLWKPSMPYNCWEGPARPDARPKLAPTLLSRILVLSSSLRTLALLWQNETQRVLPFSRISAWLAQ